MKRWLCPMILIPTLLTLFGLSSSTSVAGPVQITPLPPVENTDGRAGACYSFYYDPDPNRPFIQMAYDAGSRWDRFDFAWPTIEPYDNGWNFNPHDTLVDDLTAAGVNIVGILQMTPQWAGTQCGGVQGATSEDLQAPGWYPPSPRALPPTLKSRDETSQALAPQDEWKDPWTKTPPQGLYLPWDDPDNRWGHYVYNVVSHFSARGVKHWEMWNEPEWNLFWCGSEADYAQLLKVGYQATKAACPDCKVLFGGLHYFMNKAYYKDVLDILNDDPLASQNNYFFDAMSVHLYSRSDNAYDIVNDIRDGMTERVSDHPIWITETGVPVWNDGSVDPRPDKYDYAATQKEAAAYTIQSYAYAWASGVERYFFFRTHDAGMGEYFGLIRNDHSLRPAYVAYQVATTYLVAPTMVTNWRYSDGTQRVTLWGTPRGKVSVLWNTTPSPLAFDYPATVPTATLVDSQGLTQTITAANGVYTLQLPGATANLVSDPDDYLIGGDPYLVIEEAAASPSMVSMQPLPPTTYSHTIVIKCTAEAGEAGLWGYELQVKEGSGSWITLPGIHPSPILLTDREHGKRYCFRARAWDNTGSYGQWPASAQACTTIDLDRDLHLSVGAVFGDEDSDRVWDSGNEDSLSSVSFRFVDASGADAVPPASGSSWEFTTSLMAGEYSLAITPQDWSFSPGGWMPRWIPVAVNPGAGTITFDQQAVGLFPHRSSMLLPIISQNHSAP